jgi:hypothetical protein
VIGLVIIMPFYRLQAGEVVTTIPTIGFNVETVTYQNLKFQVIIIISKIYFRFIRLIHFHKMLHNTLKVNL